MSPLQRSNNIAARMGRWSATHRKKAIFGWLAFVVALGRNRRVRRDEADRPEQLERRRGPSRRPDAARRGIPDRPADRVRPDSEQDAHLRRCCVQGVVQDTIVAVQPHRAVFTNLKSPLDPRNRTQVSNDGHTALVEFDDERHRQRGEEGHRPGRQGNRRRPGEAPRLLRLRGRLDLHGQGARQALQLTARECRRAVDPADALDPRARVRRARRGRHPTPPAP